MIDQSTLICNTWPLKTIPKAPRDQSVISIFETPCVDTNLQLNAIISIADKLEQTDGNNEWICCRALPCQLIRRFVSLVSLMAWNPEKFYRVVPTNIVEVSITFHHKSGPKIPALVPSSVRDPSVYHTADCSDTGGSWALVSLLGREILNGLKVTSGNEFLDKERAVNLTK